MAFNPYSTRGREQRALRSVREGDAGNIAPGGATAGGGGRVERALRQSPRDNVHFREEYGSTMSDQLYQDLTAEEESFRQYTQDRKTEITSALDKLEADATTAEKNLWKSYQQSLGKVGSPKDPNAEFSNWKSSWVRFDIDPGIPTTIEQGEGRGPIEIKPNTNPIYVPKEVASQFIEQVNKSDMSKVEGSTIKLIRDPRIAAISDANTLKFRAEKAASTWQNMASAVQTQASTQWWANAGPQIVKYNQQVGKAKADVKNAYTTQLRELQTTVAKERGTGKGYLDALGQEIDARSVDLKTIRASYSDRLSRINDALRLSVGSRGRAGSISKAEQPKALSPEVEGPR